ncbi:hypothetical protein JCM5353_006443 [Sporobolomyces roseus]
MTASGADQAFLEIGRHCSEQSCRQLDFLPFKCPCCSLPFCSTHWRPPTGHLCSSYDPSLYDNRIPSCPLCSLPIPLPTPQTDPNIPMDSHFSLSCPTLHPHLAKPKKPSNECEVSKCKTKLIVKMECLECGGKYCTTHRYGKDHGCEERRERRRKEKEEERKKKKASSFLGGAMFGSKSTSTPIATGSRGRTKENGNRPPPVVGQAGLAALRRAQQALSTSTSSSSVSKPTPSTSSSATKPSNLNRGGNSASSSSSSDIEIVSFTPASSEPKPTASSNTQPKSTASRKDTKRAKEEEASARKALEVRYQKGILSESEKIRWAELRAKEHVQGSGEGKKDGCNVS